MAICDKCGNYDKSYKEDLDYTTDSHLEAQNFQPDLYYYWDSPLEEDMTGENLYQIPIVFVKYVLIYSTQKVKSSGLSQIHKPVEKVSQDTP